MPTVSSQSGRLSAVELGALEEGSRAATLRRLISSLICLRRGTYGSSAALSREGGTTPGLCRAELVWRGRRRDAVAVRAGRRH